MGQLGYAGADTPHGKTSSADLRRFLGALWVNTDRNPVLSGGEVTGRPDRAYAVAAGVGAIQVGDGAVVLTWQAGQTALVTQPSTPRTDVIYVDSAGDLRVGTEGTFSEADVIVLRRKLAPAGMTATTSATNKEGINHALPYGASLGWLGAWININQGLVSKAGTWETMVEIPFAVRTDRIVDIELHQAIHGTVDYGLPDTDARKLAFGAMAYRILIDGVHLRSFELEYNRFRAVRSHAIKFVTVASGNHVLKAERRWTGIGTDPVFFGGGTDLEEGNFVGIRDQGVSE